MQDLLVQTSLYSLFYPCSSLFGTITEEWPFRPGHLTGKKNKNPKCHIHILPWSFPALDDIMPILT